MGWMPLPCEDWASAKRQLVSSNSCLALVDLVPHHSLAQGDGRFVIETLAGFPKMLTVVCDRSHEPQNEIWSRQQGIWAYLPGVPPEADLDLLFQSAKKILAARLKVILSEFCIVAEAED
jgi:hypothetical protein